MEDRKQHFSRPTMEKPPSLLNLTIIAVLLGLIAGFGGYLLGQNVLPSTNANYINLSQWTRGGNQAGQPLIDLAQKSAGSIAGVYRPVAAVSSVGGPLFSQDDFLGSAVVVTSDGWLMSTDQVIKNKQVVIALGDKLYEPLDLKRDLFSGAVFVKISANFLSPIDFQLTDEVKTGESLFTGIDSVHSLEDTFYTTVLANAHYVPEKYLSTEKIDYYLQLGEVQPANILAAPFFNLQGNLMGLAYKLDQETLLVPSEYLKQAVKNMLNSTERVKFGLSYVDLDNNSGFTKKGVLVYNPSVSPVTFTLPAGKAGIKAGDLILSVNNNLVSGSQSLTSIIQNYRVGEKIIIKIQRNSQTQDIEVQL
ncbi:MAG: hypothetical protein C3F02_03545 [Parcubacteria group bacterium]|nr:MAG: hypothetical protein C3F02_03545 [Parcubacteria group bacterium]